MYQEVLAELRKSHPKTPRGLPVEWLDPYDLPPTGCYITGLIFGARVIYRGLPFSASFQVGLRTQMSGSSQWPSLSDRADDVLADLDKFIFDMWFFGCGGPNHKFDGDANSVNTVLKCKGCGMVKPRNCKWDDLVATFAAYTAPLAMECARCKRDRNPEESKCWWCDYIHA